VKRSVWLERIETWLIVTAISVLTWLYAEGRNVKEHVVTLTVKLVAPSDSNLRVTQDRDQVSVTFEASAPQYEMLRSLNEPIELEVPPDRAQADGSTYFALERRLREAPALQGLGRILAVEPEAIQVRIERMVSVPMRVELDPGELTLSQISIRPEQVQLRAPSSVADLARNLALRVRLSDIPDLEELTPNIQYTRELPLVLPDLLRDAGVTLQRFSVEVSFTIRKQNEEAVIQNVPIHVRAAWDELNQFGVEIEGDTYVLSEDVRVVGPPNQIERITKDEFRVVAELQLQTGDFVPGSGSKPVVFELPPNVSLVGPPPTVRYVIRERSD